MSGTEAAPSLPNRLVDLEERLSRLLVSGWRSAAAEAGDLERIGTGFAEAGAAEIAARLGAVARATSAEEALRAIMLATTACRLLRAHLAAEAVPSGRWRALGDQAGNAQLDRVIPLARFSVPGEENGATVEVWSSLRLRGAFSADWLLLEPATVSPDWLRRPLQGRLRWVGRYPLGEGGEVQVCRLEYAAPAPGFAAGQDPLEPFRETLAAGLLAEDAWVLGGGGVLRARRYDPDELTGYAWPDERLPGALRPFMASADWMLVWVQGEVETPVAVVDADGGVVHLDAK